MRPLSFRFHLVRLSGWIAEVAGSIARWAVSSLVVLGALGFFVDGVRLGWAEQSARTVVAGALVAAALAVFLSLAVAPMLALVAWAEAHLVGWGLAGKMLAPIPVGALAIAAGYAITNVRHRQDPTMRMSLVLATTGLLLVCALANLRKVHRLVRLFAIAISVGAFLVDAVVPRWYYREIHDLVALITVFGLISVIAPWRRRLATGSCFLALGSSVVAAFGVLSFVDRAAPGWRASADQHGLYGAALSRAARALVDVDRDGFSSVAWGGDCDDWDATRNPIAVDAPGQGDWNCNGVDPPVAASEALRGLAPAQGDANLNVRSVDLVVLITVDALRADALDPRLMPRVAALAKEGVLLERGYPSGTRTGVSMPLMQQGPLGGLPLARRLSDAGVGSSLVIASHEFEALDAMAKSFGNTRLARGQERWPGTRTTQEALRTIDDAGPGSHYLWVHYYDAHNPYPDAPSPVPLPPGLYSWWSRYATGVTAADTAIGQLLDGLAARKRLDRAAIIVTGDHGEAFGEHGMLYHGASAYEPVIRVPIVIFAPELKGLRYPHLACHADLFPTILGAFGLAKDSDEAFGRSWWRLRAAPLAPLHRFVVIRSAHAASGGEILSPLLAIVAGQYKLVKTIEDNLMTLYDLGADPGERTDVASARPEVVRRLERDMEIYRDIIGYPASGELAELTTFVGKMLDQDGQVF